MTIRIKIKIKKTFGAEVSSAYQEILAIKAHSGKKKG